MKTHRLRFSIWAICILLCAGALFVWVGTYRNNVPSYLQNMGLPVPDEVNKTLPERGYFTGALRHVSNMCELDLVRDDRIDSAVAISRVLAGVDTRSLSHADAKALLQCIESIAAEWRALDSESQDAFKMALKIDYAIFSLSLDKSLHALDRAAVEAGNAKMKSDVAELKKDLEASGLLAHGDTIPPARFQIMLPILIHMEDVDAKRRFDVVLPNGSYISLEHTDVPTIEGQVLADVTWGVTHKSIRSDMAHRFSDANWLMRKTGLIDQSRISPNTLFPGTFPVPQQRMSFVHMRIKNDLGIIRSTKQLHRLMNTDYLRPWVKANLSPETQWTFDVAFDELGKKERELLYDIVLREPFFKPYIVCSGRRYVYDIVEWDGILGKPETIKARKTGHRLTIVVPDVASDYSIDYEPCEVRDNRVIALQPDLIHKVKVYKAHPTFFRIPEDILSAEELKELDASSDGS